jgi:RNA polymerase sigma-70 factor, ECF subfamily
LAAADAELVEGALDGSEQAFRELVRRYERLVFGIIVRLVRNPSRAEELSQDAFVKAFRALHTYDRGRKFSAWLLRIAHNVAIDELRRYAPEITELDAAIPDESQPPQRLVEQRELADALRTAMGRLRPEYRELVALKYEQDMEYEEIVDITGLPLGTVKSSLHRARRELAEHLEGLGWRR